MSQQAITDESDWQSWLADAATEHAKGPVVTTSARLHGRAPDGMAALLSGLRQDVFELPEAS